MKSRLATWLALLVTMLAYIPTAGAHSLGAEGGGFLTGLAHPFMGPDHLLAMIAVGVWAAQTGGSAVWRLPLSFIVMMAVAALISASGFNLPTLELLIPGSVVLLGLMVFFTIRLPVNLSMLLVGLFAVLHGYAHGRKCLKRVRNPVWGRFCSGDCIITSNWHWFCQDCLSQKSVIQA